MRDDKERLAVVEEQVKWIAPIVERIEKKVDLLSDRTSFRWGLIVGVSGLVSVLASGLMELFRR